MTSKSRDESTICNILNLTFFLADIQSTDRV